MKHFNLIVREDENSRDLSLKIKDILIENKFVYDEKTPDLVICVGGDGTILYAVNQYLERLDKCEFIGIHTGTLGFLTDYTSDELDLFIQDILRNEPVEVFEAPLLETTIDRKTYYAINEFRIENPLYTQCLDIFIDGEFFERFKGNGVCLSTQVGSTAYNRSLKGAVIDSGVSLMQLSEVAGIHDKKHNSLGVSYILKADRKVEFVGEFKKVNLIYDYQHIELDGSYRLKCKLGERKVRFVRYRKYSYLDRVRSLY